MPMHYGRGPSDAATASRRCHADPGMKDDGRQYVDLLQEQTGACSMLAGEVRNGCLEQRASAVTSSNGANVSSLAAKRIATRVAISSSLLDNL